ncbi:MAG: ABC transporter ATP-binding protein [Epsilonproteobacteria bacterium]|nr:ABC transporter ATP-binding protein [Campylobacterota bacterium]
MNLIHQIYTLLSKRDRLVVLGLLGISFLVSLIEMASITGVMAFISLATRFDVVEQNKYYVWGRDILGSQGPFDFFLVTGFLLIAFYLLRSVLNVALVFVITRFSFAKHYDFSTRFFQHFLSMNTGEVVRQNSAAISSMIFHASVCFTYILSSLLIVCAEVLTILSVYGMLVYINWKMTVLLTILLAAQSGILIFLFSRSIKKAGNKSHIHSVQTQKIFNESFGNFKLIRLLSNQDFMTEKFNESMLGYSRANALNATLQACPRFVLEGMGCTILLAIIIYFICYRHDHHAMMPIVSMYSLAFYRFLPSVNKILACVNQVFFSRPAVDKINDYVACKTEQLGDEQIEFKNQIALQDISFAYPGRTPVLSTISLEITKGEHVAIIGSSGGGKSTLLDLMMGVHCLEHGKILIDGKELTPGNLKAWRKKIGYIPQAIYLFDGTVAQNVVFGRAYDQARVVQCLREAHIYEYLQTLEGIQTQLGEGGVKLSGGQKQRIAIARALYGNPELLILDEATSALDSQTEAAVMRDIYQENQNKTMIIVAHRLSTVARCDKIYELDGNGIRCVSYDQLENVSRSYEEEHKQTLP